jgi:hypothetical protein
MNWKNEMWWLSGSSQPGLGAPPVVSVLPEYVA